MLSGSERFRFHMFTAAARRSRLKARPFPFQYRTGSRCAAPRNALNQDNGLNAFCSERPLISTSAAARLTRLTARSQLVPAPTASTGEAQPRR